MIEVWATESANSQLIGIFEIKSRFVSHVILVKVSTGQSAGRSVDYLVLLGAGMKT